MVRRTFSTSFGLLPLQNNFSFKYLVAGSNLFGSIDSITASKRHWYDSVSCEPFTSSSCMKKSGSFCSFSSRQKLYKNVPENMCGMHGLGNGCNNRELKCIVAMMQVWSCANPWINSLFTGLFTLSLSSVLYDSHGPLLNFCRSCSELQFLSNFFRFQCRLPEEEPT